MPASTYFIALLCLAGSLLAADPQQGPNPLNGTWKLNLAKSKYNPGPPDKSLTRTYEFTGDTIKAHSESIGADGKPGENHFTAKYDGKEYPFSGSTNVVTLSLKRMDASTSEFGFKRNGKPVSTSLLRVSENGRLLTITRKGTENGHPIDNVEVFDRQ